MRKSELSRSAIRAAAFASVAVLVIAAACNIGELRAPTVAPTVTSIALNPKQATLPVGDSVSVTATPEDSTGAVVTGATVAWGSSADSVATVSTAGEVHAVGPGQTTITATVNGKAGMVHANLPVNVSLVPVASVVLTPSDTLSCLVGGTALAPPPIIGPAPAAGSATCFRTRVVAVHNQSRRYCVDYSWRQMRMRNSPGLHHVLRCHAFDLSRYRPRQGAGSEGRSILDLPGVAGVAGWILCQ